MEASKSKPENDDKQKDVFSDAPDEFPFYESSSSSSSSTIHQTDYSSHMPNPNFVSPTGPRLRRRSLSHRFRDETNSVNDPESSSLSSNHTIERNKEVSHTLLAENEFSDLNSGEISLGSGSFGVDKEIKDDSAVGFGDTDANPFVILGRKKRLAKVLEELEDENDSSKGYVVNFNKEIKDDNFNIPNGEISSNSVSSMMNSEIIDSKINRLVGFDYNASEERKKRFVKKLKELDTRKGNSDSQTTRSLDEENRDDVESTGANNGEPVINESSLGFLFWFAGFIIKAIGFQLSLLVSVVIFPIRFLYGAYMFVVDPFQISRRVRKFVWSRLSKIVRFVCEKFFSFAGEWLKEHKSIWQLVLRFGWGFLWAGYVCIVLVSLLLAAFVLSGVLIRKLVEEPIQMKEALSFDYTKNSPVAFVPLISCPVEPLDFSSSGKSDAGNTGISRVIPQNHKLEATVSLTLPESDYNRNLGVFQVKVDLLSTNGRALASLRRPCMLHFKSQPIRMLLTFFKVAPLVTGYLSEAQTLKINLKGLTEGDIPTACLRVTIEQRAEFRPGAGIPEIYEASLTLETELPLLKKLMWQWKKTIFIWLGLSLFAMQLVFALVCCRPLILPRGRVREGSEGDIALQR